MRATYPALLLFLLARVGTPQAAIDWPSYGGDALRSGWERSDTRITKENVKDFKLVLKRQLKDGPGGPFSLTPPVIIGRLISYRGFKELGFVAADSGDVWSIDVDLNRVFWHKKFQPRTPDKSPGCTGGLTAIPALTPPARFGARRPAASSTGAGASQSPGLPPTPAGRSTELPARLGGGGFGGPRPVYILSGDGMLRQVNTATGDDQFPPLKFLPANAKASALTLNDYVMYTTTSSGCGGVPNALWALDLRAVDPEPVHFVLSGGNAGGLGGYAVGNDGTVYVQTGPGQSDPAAGKYSNTLLALMPRDLKVKGYFSVADTAESAPDMNVATPVVFEYNGRDLVVSAGRDGRLYVLDSQTIGGTDHKSPLSQTVRVAAPNGGIWGGLSTWEDAEGVRWVAAPVWGGLNPELKVPLTNGSTPNGSIVAFRVEEQNGAAVLVPAWVSRDLQSPVPPVVTMGTVFALSTGGYTREGSELRPNGSGRATLYGFDAETGKEVYSTGNQVTAPGTLMGLSVANGRVFFTTVDNTLYAFGVYMEI